MPLPTRLRIVFFGSGAFGLPTLQALDQAHDVLAVVTQPDRPAGRGGRLTPTPIAAWWSQNHPSRPLFKPERVNTPEVLDAIRAFHTDAWVVIAFGQKLSTKLLADRFAVNLHGSLLPRWRGAAPINAAILAGDAHAGNTVITLADKMDAGLMLGTSTRPITPETTAGDLHDALAADGPALMLDVLARHAEGSLTPQQQDEPLVTLAPKISRADAHINFKSSAADCLRRVHAYSPWPGVTVMHREKPLKLLRAAAEHSSQTQGHAPGTLIDPAAGIIACGEGCLRVIELHPAGGKPMPWAEYARGRHPLSGEVFTCDPATS
jgi:methionyl-tRNA formyltransferase